MLLNTCSFKNAIYQTLERMRNKNVRFLISESITAEMRLMYLTVFSAIPYACVSRR